MTSSAIFALPEKCSYGQVADQSEFLKSQKHLLNKIESVCFFVDSPDERMLLPPSSPLDRLWLVIVDLLLPRALNATSY